MKKALSDCWGRREKNCPRRDRNAKKEEGRILFFSSMPISPLLRSSVVLSPTPPPPAFTYESPLRHGGRGGGGVTETKI